MAKSEVFLYVVLCWTSFSNAQYRDPGYYDHDADHEDLHQYDEPTNTHAQKAINPCHPSYHRLINNQPQRSYNYRLGSSSHREQVLCDRDLTPGWYRFHSLAGDTIPTSCPGVNYCGTRAPVWMKGSIPTTEEGIVKASGCVSVQGKCCTTQIPMLVRNCSDFIVYHLQPTPACPAAYCAGYEVPCPTGLSSDNGYTPCHFPVDLLETKVSFGMSKDLTQIQFFCDVTLGGHVVPESVALEVEWLADEETIQSETFGLLQQHKGVLKEDKWTVGQTLQCRARARHTSINTFTSIVTSPPLITGIVITSPSTLVINEGAEPAYVELQSNIPITCPPKKKKPAKAAKKEEKKEEEQEEPEEEECCVAFEITTRGSNTPRCADGSQFDLIVLNSCSYKVCADEWNATHRIPVWAVNDGLIGGAHEDGGSEPSTVFIDIRTVEPSPPRWQEISLPSQEIHITHGDVQERCVTDEATTTFDGLSYSNRLEGTFVLYRHDTLPYEVQLQLKKCNQRPICNCAVAVRFGDTMLAADVCTTGKTRFWSYTSDGNYVEPSKISHLPQIVRIDEGRSFQIQFPTGTRINLGPNLRFITIQASLPDLEHTSGLCGSFDRDLSNDLVTFKGQVICAANTNVTSPCDDFSKAWRLSHDQSLFTGTFNNDGLSLDEDSHVDDTLSPGHCSCSSLKKAAAVELRPKAKSRFSSYPYEEYQTEEPVDEEAENNNKDKCSSSQCVDPRGVDVTHQLLELVFDDDFSSEDENLGRGRVSEAAELEPVFQGETNALLAQQSSKKEWTEDEAEVFCLRMIEGVPTAKLCRDIAHVNVDIHTKACKHEVLHTKSAIWSMDALEQLRWECRDQVYHNISIWEPQLGRQHGTPPLGVLSSLCLNNCSGLGSCENGQCRCSSGYSGSDCSVNINLPPQVTHLSHKGVCDIRNKPCSEILVWGSRMADHATLKCHFDIYRTASVKSVPVLSETVMTNGRLLTYQSIICDVPELPIHDAKISSFYIPGEGLDKTRTLARLSVSYGAQGPRSGALDYTVFDSLCWSCDAGPLACTPTPSQSCNVLSEPFGSGSDPFLQNNSPFNSPGFSQSNIPLQHSPDSSGFGIQGVGVTQLHPHLSGPCALPKDPGPCRNDFVRYYFDTGTRTCKPFIFGGCQGNSNNFESETTCAAACLRSEHHGNLQSSPSDGQLVHANYYEGVLQLPEQCRQKNEGKVCSDEQVQYYFDILTKKCRPIIACPESANFVSKDLCLETCEISSS